MPDDNTQTSTAVTEPSILNIPDETRAKFPDIIAMIEKSKAMNDEERQYWVDVLPIMNEGQVDNLKNILTNEQKQMQQAQNKYKTGVEAAAEAAKTKFNDFEYKEKQRIRKEEEARHEEEEKEREEAILNELENL